MLPATQTAIVYFATYLSRIVSPPTVQVYLAAVSALHRHHGYQDPTADNYQLTLVRKGIQRSHAKGTKHTRKPITIDILRRMVQQLYHNNHLHTRDKHMIAAAFTLAFFGFLRISELTVPSHKTFDPRCHPSLASIRWHKRHYTFRIRTSKTDQLFGGHTVTIPQIKGGCCPFSTMAKYWRHQTAPPTTKPLFTFANGTPLTRHSCLRHITYCLKREGYDPTKYNTHSFRIGAATSAAKAGLSNERIKSLGRWKSDVYRRYVRSNHANKTAAHDFAARIAHRTL